MSIEAPRAQQSRIEYVRPVRRGDNDNALVALKTIHLHQHLVERLFAFVVASTETRTAMTTDRVELIYKDDARCLLLCLFEHVANAGCTNANKHFDKIRAGNRKKRHFRFARDRFRKQRLTGARWANHEHALGNLAAEALIFARVFKKVDDFRYFGFSLLDTRDIRERHTDLIFAQQPCLALAE